MSPVKQRLDDGLVRKAPSLSGNLSHGGVVTPGGVLALGDAMFGGGGEGANEAFGQNRFAEKQAALEEDKNNSMDAERALELSKELSAELSKELKNAAAVFADSIVPGFIRRLMNQKVYHKLAKDVEEKQNQEHENVVATIMLQKSHYKSEAKKRNQLKARNRAHSVLETEAKKELEEAKAVKQMAQVVDYKERRARQLEEVQSSIDVHVNEMRARMEAELIARRAFNLSHWSEQAAVLHDEAVDASQRKAEGMRQKFRDPIEIATSDWQDRDLSRAKLQVEGEGVSSPVKSSKFGGLFGVNTSPDARAPADVHLFSSRDAYRGFEQANLELFDAQGQSASIQALYDALNLDGLQQQEGRSASYTKDPHLSPQFLHSTSLNPLHSTQLMINL